ncbi:hypothetical protein JCM13664_09330 [Methylothermus subterraneus]
MPVSPVVVIGLGELGGVFALGFLRAGYPVYPVLRGMDLAAVGRDYPEPALVLVAVGEDDFHPVLAGLPPVWRDRLGLIQNELMPRDWRQHGLESVSVAVVWFEKRPGQPLVNILDTPVYGPKAALLAEALTKLGVPTRILPDEEALVFELAKKSLYILTVNLAGLITGGTVGELWHRHAAFAREVAEEVLTVLEWRAGRPLPKEALIAGVAAGIEDCPNRACLGRRARARLARVLEEARQAGIALPCLTGIWQRLT